MPAKAVICDSLRVGPLTVVVANVFLRSLAAVSNHLMGASSKAQWLYWKTGQPCAAKCSRAQSTRCCFSSQITLFRMSVGSKVVATLACAVLWDMCA